MLGKIFIVLLVIQLAIVLHILWIANTGFDKPSVSKVSDKYLFFGAVMLRINFAYAVFYVIYKIFTW